MALWIIPTLHPAALIRDQTMALAVHSDLEKAVRIQQDGHPTLVPDCYRAKAPMPEDMLFPRVDTVQEWLDAHRHTTLSIDIESTYSGQIMCVGLWPVEDALNAQGLCVPIHKKGGGKYWNTLEDLQVKEVLFEMLQDVSWPKVGQNFTFDTGRMRESWGITVRGVIGDSMIASWCCMPELPQGLAFLSSIFTDLTPYKSEVHTNESSEKDDVDKWSHVQEYDDRNLREYCLLDTFATALAWIELEEMMGD